MISIEQLSAIDFQALRCCRKLSPAESVEFFHGESKFPGSMRHLHRKREVFARGARQGERRDVYRIEGREFIRLWKMIQAYVVDQTKASHWPRINSQDYEDSLSAVRERLILLLTFYGPRPSNIPFSSAMRVVTAQTLVNQANLRFNNQAYRMLSDAASLSASGEVEDYQDDVY